MQYMEPHIISFQGYITIWGTRKVDYIHSIVTSCYGFLFPLLSMFLTNSIIISIRLFAWGGEGEVYNSVTKQNCQLTEFVPLQLYYIMTIRCPNLLYYLDSQQLYVGIQIVQHPFIQLIVQRFSLCQSAAWEMAPCGLICISLITKEVIILFICLLPILVSCTVKCKSLLIRPLDCEVLLLQTN